MTMNLGTDVEMTKDEIISAVREEFIHGTLYRKGLRMVLEDAFNSLSKESRDHYETQSILINAEARELWKLFSSADAAEGNKPKQALDLWTLFNSGLYSIKIDMEGEDVTITCKKQHNRKEGDYQYEEKHIEESDGDPANFAYMVRRMADWARRSL